MTKKQMFEAIKEHLKENGKSVCVADYGYELRSGFARMKAYEMKFDNGELYCYPWADANIMWRTDFFRLQKPQIEAIYNRTMSK